MADDAVLVDFLATLEDYVPAIPDELVDYYLSTSGLSTQDIRLTRLVGLATQKFISEVASDALHQTKLRLQSSRSLQQTGKEKSPRLVLTSDDLTTALKEFGVNFKKQDYYADSAAAGTSTTTPQQQSSDQQLS